MHSHTKTYGLGLEVAAGASASRCSISARRPTRGSAATAPSRRFKYGDALDYKTRKCRRPERPRREPLESEIWSDGSFNRRAGRLSFRGENTYPTPQAAEHQHPCQHNSFHHPWTLLKKHHRQLARQNSSRFGVAVKSYSERTMLSDEVALMG